MKKRIWLVFVICLCCLLSGCCMEHDWQPASCTAPETCAKCGETQGEMLSHQWTEANYQTPETCAVCGATQGTVLTPDFETHGLSCNMELGKTYDYLTVCYDDHSYTTIGQATVKACEMLSPTPEREDLDGYEWRGVTVEIVFSDENAWAYGMYVGWSSEDYYDIEGLYDSSETDEDGTTTFAVNWNGQSYDRCISRYTHGFSEWKDHQRVCTIVIEYRLPVGYDGIVVALYNQGTPWDEGDYIYDVADADSLFFRMA